MSDKDTAVVERAHAMRPYSVIGGNSAVAGGKTAVVFGGNSAVVDGKTAVVFGGDSAVVDGKSAVVFGGDSAVVDGKSAVAGNSQAACANLQVISAKPGAVHRVNRWVVVLTSCSLLLVGSIVPACALELAPGPCLEKRQEVQAFLEKAKKSGIGTKPYEDALERIETNVKDGQPEPEIHKQVISLIDALKLQVYNLKVLKITAPRYKAISGTGKGGGSGAAGGEQAGNTAARVSESEMEAHMLTLLNKHRQNSGLGPLSANSFLAEVARAHAADMAKRKFFAHVNPDGRDPMTRAAMAGYRGRVKENIAYTTSYGNGLATTEVADNTLWNSPGHKANMLSTDVATVGIGIVYDAAGGIRVCQLFGD